MSIIFSLVYDYLHIAMLLQLILKSHLNFIGCHILIIDLIIRRWCQLISCTLNFILKVWMVVSLQKAKRLLKAMLCSLIKTYCVVLSFRGAEYFLQINDGLIGYLNKTGQLLLFVNPACSQWQNNILKRTKICIFLMWTF